MRQLQKNIHYSHTSVYHSVNMTKKVEEGFVQTRSFDVFILQNIVAEHYNAEKKTQFSITEIFGCGKNERQSSEILNDIAPIALVTWFIALGIRVGPQVEKSSNLHITADLTGSIHENVRGKKFAPKKVRLGWGNLS